MPGHQGVSGLFRRLFPRRPLTPAERWLERRASAAPEEVIREYFAAIAAHDLDWMLATMAPERARLWNEPRTLDKRRLTVKEVVLHNITPVSEGIPLPAFANRYVIHQVYRVEFELWLVEPSQRRDPTLREGRQWAYFVLVSEGRGHPWLIADWGTP